MIVGLPLAFRISEENNLFLTRRKLVRVCIMCNHYQIKLIIHFNLSACRVIDNDLFKVTKGFFFFLLFIYFALKTNM